MLERTRDLVAEIKQMPFFVAVGTATAPDIEAVNSWSEALRANRAKQWDWILMEARNTLTRILAVGHPKRFARWNDITAEVRPEIEPVVQRLIRTVEERERPLFEATLAWTLLAICMEKEYEDISTTELYQNLWKWYQRGHFGCGWHGPIDPGGDYERTLRSGKLVVF